MPDAGKTDVLVIDDEPVVLEVIRRVLEEEGLRVAVAVDSATGLSHPAADSCRLILCDLMLPDGSGIDLIRTMRERRRDLPMVVVTGYATSESATAAREAGAAGFLPKPFTDVELLDAVRRALATSAESEMTGDRP